MEDIEATIYAVDNTLGNFCAPDLTDVSNSLDKIAEQLARKRDREEEALCLEPIHNSLRSYLEDRTEGCYQRSFNFIAVRATTFYDDDTHFDANRACFFLHRTQYALLRETHCLELEHWFENHGNTYLRENRWMRIVTIHTKPIAAEIQLEFVVKTFGPAEFSFGPHECRAAVMHVAGEWHQTPCKEGSSRNCDKCKARLACHAHNWLVRNKTDKEVCDECED